MDGSALADRELASQHAVFAHVVGRAGRVIRPAPGVLATVVASVPERSLPNSVLYEDPSSLTDALLDELQELYAASGVRAWTVWVRPGHDELAARLAARGHAHDAQPLLMAAELDAMDIAPRAPLELEPDPDWRTLGVINDRAYGFERALERLLGAVGDDPASRLWIARAGGRPAAGLAIRTHRGDATLLFVATVPEARGRGLASELLRRGLTAAREAGATTTSLEATALGEPVYRRLGYRGLGRFGMWELRRPA